MSSLNYDIIYFIIKDHTFKLVIPEVRNTAVHKYHTTHLYKCQSGQMIWEIYQCDGIAQCPDGSDEDNCKFVLISVFKYN